MKREPQKIAIEVTLFSFYRSDTIKSFLEQLEECKERIKLENIYDIRFDIDYERGYYDSVDLQTNVVGKRLETDEEFNLRLGKDVKAEEQQKQWEIAEMERLMRKHGRL